MNQSRHMSLVEAVTNVVVGYVLAAAMQIVVFSWFGLHTSLGQNLTISTLFTGISLVRSYTLRRVFKRWG